MDDSTFRHIVVERADGIGWLRYHRPPVNAVDWDMLRELPRALESLIAAPGTRVIVVASALDRHFSAGADLGSFGGALPFDAGLDLELEEAVALAESPDFTEGIEAFLARRPPRWI